MKSVGSLAEDKMSIFKRKKYDPDIIDLVRYEKDLLYQREHGIACRPPPKPLGNDYRIWSIAEKEAMRDNREKAQIIYDRISRS